MRRTIALVLVGLGGFLLVAGILATVWVPGAVKKTPLDVDTTTWLSGEAAKIDTESGELEPRPMYAVSVTQTDADASTDDVAVWAQRQCANFGDVPPDAEDALREVDDDELAEICTDQEDPDHVSAAQMTFATDRVTAEGVPIEDLPDDTLPTDAVRVEGLVNKFPFDTEKKDYPYWESTIGRAVDAVYDRTEQVEGVETYVFRVEVTEEPIEVAPDIDGTYSDVKEIFVEPKTGSILNQTDDQQRWLADGTQVLDLQLAFTDEQIASNADDAESNMARLRLLTTIMPVVGLVGGALLLVAGVVLALTGRRGQEQASEGVSQPMVNA